MTSINKQMGLKAAGKRSMMKLPTARAIRSAITSAQCPACQRYGARLKSVDAETIAIWCFWCGHDWTVAKP
jgi:hypothetical protein